VQWSSKTRLSTSSAFSSISGQYDAGADLASEISQAVPFRVARYDDDLRFAHVGVLYRPSPRVTA
jgi:hypothetical protein